MTHIPTIIQARISIPVAPQPSSTSSSSPDTTTGTLSQEVTMDTSRTPSSASEIAEIRGDAKRGYEILRAEAAAILSIAERFDAEMDSLGTQEKETFPLERSVPTLRSDRSYSMVDSFHAAVRLVLRCRGDVVVTGIGKAGHVGRKISATFASTGTRSFFLHPAEAVHGDLGRLGPDDLVLALSQSGETEEMTRLLSFFSQQEIPVIAITGRCESRLGRASRVVLELGQIPEACRLDLAPSSSTTAMLAMGDALALVVSEAKCFERGDFSKFHPAGNLGKRLAKVDDFARALTYCRVSSDSLSIRGVFTTHVMPGRRSGAMMLTDAEGRLTGIFTDSDLAKLFEQRQETMLDHTISEVMTHTPLTVRSGAPISEAVHLMASRKISELPVVDAENRPIGLIDITDLLAAFPKELGEKNRSDRSL